MGTEAAWVPLVLAAVSAGGEAYNQHNVAKRQEDAAQDLQRSQQRKQHDVNDRLNAELDTLKGSDAEDERKQSLDGFLQQLQANAGNAAGSAPVTGSDRFAADTAASQADIQNYGTNRADITSRLIAPGEQRRNEGYVIGRTQDDVAGIAREARAKEFLNQLRMSTIRANPWVTAGSQVGMSAAGSMAGRMPAPTMAGGAAVPPGVYNSRLTNLGGIGTSPGSRIFGGGGPLGPR